MQEPPRTMSRRQDDGEVVIESHDNNAAERSGGGGAAELDDGERTDRPEPFFPCVDDRAAFSDAERVVDDEEDTEFPDGGDEEEEGDDVRVSFASAVGDHLREEQSELDEGEEGEEDVSRYDYGMWMEAEPMSIQERRRRLLQGMGLAASSRDLLRGRGARVRSIPPNIPRCTSRRPSSQAAAAADDAQPSTSAAAPVDEEKPLDTVKRQRNGALTRCRSDSRLAVRGGGAARKTQSFRRVGSVPHSLHGSPVHKALRAAARCPMPSAASSKDGREDNGDSGNSRRGITIKNLDDGKEFVVSGQPADGSWGALSDPQSGVKLSLDEFGRFIGYTPLVKQLMRRSQSQPVPAGAANGGTKPEKKKPRWFKNIKLVASAAGLIHEKEKDGNGGGCGGARTAAAQESASAVTMSKSASANASMASSSSLERPKVHSYGKSGKDLTGLCLRQEVRAHEGSIWCIKFSPDGMFLASGGEDRVVHVWRVTDADAPSSVMSPQLSASQSLPPLPSQGDGGSLVPGLAAQLSRKARVRRWKSGKDVLPEHIVVPETVFALADEPACSLEGHLDDVLDLAWSKSQVELPAPHSCTAMATTHPSYLLKRVRHCRSHDSHLELQQLLSSSMDKTVRLWDTEAKACLKLFPHNDYVTCVQFNPVDDGYFISGSLDSKVRIWSVAERQVVDWSDLDDMVTAACYTPDGQAAIIGSHKGSCRFYKATDCKLNQEAQIDMSISKKRKSHAKKITGFQFAPGNPSEILVTSADSQIRVFNGITVLQKFKGFKNTSSQISAAKSVVFSWMSKLYMLVGTS
uniref:Anaphase-promoting complex subunit 4 WD40 domain-containing protein n=1 Tax=Oryza brachyantha TaxID=4533 RepID=J3N6K4_ORYBR